MKLISNIKITIIIPKLKVIHSIYLINMNEITSILCQLMCKTIKMGAINQKAAKSNKKSIRNSVKIIIEAKIITLEV